MNGVASGERQVRRRPYSLERHALRLELLHPGRRAVLALVHLVLLVAHEAAELVVADGLGVVVVVAVLVREADDRRAARREAVVELADGVAEVARVARAVAEAEERDLLPAEVRVRQLAVEPVVDVRACVSVVGGRSASRRQRGGRVRTPHCAPERMSSAPVFQVGAPQMMQSAASKSAALTSAMGVGLMPVASPM